MESSQTEHARIFGGRLFGALFQDRVRDVYQGAMSDADRSGHGLRITLSLTDTPELMDLPWEFLYDEPNFLAISVMTPVVRYLDLPRPRRPLTIEPPLRILGDDQQSQRRRSAGRRARARESRARAQRPGRRGARRARAGSSRRR